MIPVSQDFIVGSEGEGDPVFEITAEQEDTVLFSIAPTGGGVDVDVRNQVRRKLRVELVDETSELIPAGASDVFNPTVGTILRVRGGVAMTRTGQHMWIDNDAVDFAAGTHVFTVVDGGDLMLQ